MGGEEGMQDWGEAEDGEWVGGQGHGELRVASLG